MVDSIDPTVDAGAAVNDAGSANTAAGVNGGAAAIDGGHTATGSGNGTADPTTAGAQGSAATGGGTSGAGPAGGASGPGKAGDTSSGGNAAPRPANTGSNAPAFIFANDVRDENFNLKPRPGRNAPVPEDQRAISHQVYEVRNILLQLKLDKAIPDAASFKEFIERVVQAAETGCVMDYVDTKLAGEALDQIRADIVRRVGTPLIYIYLRALAMWAGIGVVLGFAAAIIGTYWWVAISGYGPVVIGAMIGAWFAVAAARWKIAFDTIPDYHDTIYEPAIRMLFVALGAVVVAVFLHLAVVTLKIGSVDLAGFKQSISVALLLGFVAGVAGRDLSVQLVDRAQKVLNPGAK